jgi:hypothetical protein
MRKINSVLIVALALFSLSSHAQYNEIANCKSLGNFLDARFGISDEGDRYQLLFKAHSNPDIPWDHPLPAISGYAKKAEILKFTQREYGKPKVQIVINMATGLGHIRLSQFFKGIIAEEDIECTFKN